jgi:hypothetical protein
LIPATAPGVISLEATSMALRVIVTPAAGASRFELHDGGLLSVDATPTTLTIDATAGALHRDFRYEIDWGRGPTGGIAPSSTDLAEVADGAALLSCPAPGCWWFDAATETLFVRFHGLGAQAGSATFR